MKKQILFNVLIMGISVFLLLIFEIVLFYSVTNNHSPEAMLPVVQSVDSLITPSIEYLSAEEEVKAIKETYTITAYCPCKKCCGKSDGITASGAKAVEGVTIAADTSVLPFGTKVEIDGNIYTVQDRGGAVKGKKIDIYFDNHEKALQYGKQVKEVTILKGE